MKLIERVLVVAVAVWMGACDEKDGTGEGASGGFPEARAQEQSERAASTSERGSELESDESDIYVAEGEDEEESDSDAKSLGCDAPPPETLHYYEGGSITALAVSGGELVYGTRDGVFAVAKDGGGTARALAEIADVRSLVARQGEVYFAAKDYHAYRVPVAGGTPVALGPLSVLAGGGESSVYGHRDWIGCADDSTVLVYEGSEESYSDPVLGARIGALSDLAVDPRMEWSLPCVRAVAVSGDTVAAVDREDGMTDRVVLLGESGPKKLFGARLLNGMLAVTAGYVYVGLPEGEDYEDQSEIGRVSLETGTLEVVGSRRLIGSFASSGDQVVLGDHKCLRSMRDGDTEWVDLAQESLVEDVAFDDRFAYGVSGSSIFRVAR